jgi:hypothetical protein
LGGAAGMDGALTDFPSERTPRNAIKSEPGDAFPSSDAAGAARRANKIWALPRPRP